MLRIPSYWWWHNFLIFLISSLCTESPNLIQLASSCKTQTPPNTSPTRSNQDPKWILRPHTPRSLFSKTWGLISLEFWNWESTKPRSTCEAAQLLCMICLICRHISLTLESQSTRIWLLCKGRLLPAPGTSSSGCFLRNSIYPQAALLSEEFRVEDWARSKLISASRLRFLACENLCRFAIACNSKRWLNLIECLKRDWWCPMRMFSPPSWSFGLVEKDLKFKFCTMNFEFWDSCCAWFFWKSSWGWWFFRDDTHTS